MKNNLVKILATLGLIVAIALILRGVFDVGKIGFNKIGNKSSKKIIFENCWDVNDYDSYEQSMKTSSQENQIFEIDISNNRITRTTIWTDKFVQEKKDMQNKGISINANKVDLDTMMIDSHTDDFITTTPFKVIDHNNNNKLLGTDTFIFNLNDNTYENTFVAAGNWSSTSNNKCEN
jgi:hypothetical protein